MSTKTTDTEREISHPLEEVFDLEENTTVVPYKEVKTDLVKHEPFDPKDKELEEQLQVVYDAALEAFENQQEDADTIEPRFKARNAEVAVQYLKTALEAVHEKSMLKQHKDKVVIRDKTGGTVNNNVVLTDRNELLRLLRGKEEKPVNTVVDGEFEEVHEDKTTPN